MRALARLAPALALTSWLLAAAHAGGQVRAVGTIGLTVADAGRSAAFYDEVLDFETVADFTVTGAEDDRLRAEPAVRRRVVRMRLGREVLELTEYLMPRGRPIPADSRSHDRWFQHVAIIVSDMDAAYARLRQHGVRHVSPAPQRLPDWNASAGGIRAFYFNDPDGHPLEILWFPSDKGEARWQRRDGGLFLGIDHTAIVVADTAASLRCYRDALGLRVAGESENHGPEQERLNDVPGARLRITTLRAPAGPGIEFLEYLTPRDARSIPPDARANDLTHWHTSLVTDDAEALHRSLRGSACVTGTSGAVTAGSERAVLIRDPDGHALRVVER